MRRTVVTRLALSSFAVPALLTACGAGAQPRSAAPTPQAKLAYEQAMRQVGRETDDAIGSLGAPPKRSVAAASYLRSEAHIYDVEAARLRAIVPPADVAADHRELITEDRAVARTYRRLASAIQHPRRGHPPPASAALNLVPRSFRVLSDYRAKGYDLGALTGSG